MFVPDDHIRLSILTLLYKRCQENPESPGIDRAIIEATFGLTKKQLDTNMLQLEEKGLVALSRIGPSWVLAKITEDGFEAVENKEKYAEKFSSNKPQPSTKLTAAQSMVPQALPEENLGEMQPEVTFSQQLTDAFNQAYNRIRSENLPDSERKKLEKQVSSLEKNLRRDRIEFGSIQKDWDEIRKRANWLSPVLAPVVLETLERALGLH